MPNCISCGRELPSANEPHNICPECRVAIMQRAQSSVCGLAMGAALAPHLTSPPEERNTWNRWIFILAALFFAAAYYLARHFH